MSSNEKLAFLALIISTLVIIGIAVCFTALFALFSLYRSRLISSGYEDRKLMSDFNSAYGKDDMKRKKRGLLSFTKRQYFDYDKKKGRRWQTLSDIVSGIFILFFLAVLALGVTFRATGNEVYIGNTTYLTIMSGSMETKNAENTYLVDNKLDNQILAYSLIGIDKVNSPEDIKQYDIIAFKKNDGTVIVHRVVNIGTWDTDEEKADADTPYYFMTRGDANNVSAAYEQKILFKQIIGVYNGNNNFFIGTMIIYFKSGIGITALVAATFFLFLAVLALEKTTKTTNERYEYLLGLDPVLLSQIEEANKKEKEEEQDQEAPPIQEELPVEEDINEVVTQAVELTTIEPTDAQEPTISKTPKSPILRVKKEESVQEPIASSEKEISPKEEVKGKVIQVAVVSKKEETNIPGKEEAPKKESKSVFSLKKKKSKDKLMKKESSKQVRPNHESAPILKVKKDKHEEE